MSIENYRHPDTMTKTDLEQIWNFGSTPNGVFGIKINLEQKWIDAFRHMFELPEQTIRAEVWSTAFPNCSKHIFMTRRNKVRLAVSWWRAIVSGEWHRKYGEKPQEHDLADQYNYNAINHLILESTMCEAAIEDFLSEANIIPFTVVYEDFIQDYVGTVKKVLEYLEQPMINIEIAPPALDKLVDEIAEEWVQRYRKDSQKEWENIRW